MLRPALIMLAFGLAACGSNTKTTTVTGADGETVTLKHSESGGVTRMEATNDKGEKFSANVGGEGAAWPANAPAYAAAYPGARINSVVTSDSDGKAGSMVAFESSDSPAQVIAHYKQLATKTGLGDATSLVSGTMNLFSASDKQGQEFTVQASTADGKTTAVVAYSAKSG